MSRLGRQYPELWRPEMHQDPERRRRYYVWLQQKNQAQWRGEQWQLEFDQWLEIWGDQYARRGRAHADDLCLTRSDPDRAWSPDNVEIITRSEHGTRGFQSRARHAGAGPGDHP
jgi:hypothetical protein